MAVGPRQRRVSLRRPSRRALLGVLLLTASLALAGGLALLAHEPVNMPMPAGRHVRLAIERRPRAIERLSGGGRLVALTFDDGPNPVYTPQVLDILHRYHVTATFFVVGRLAQRYGGSVDYRGQAVGDHTWDHAKMQRLSDAAQEHDYRRGETALASLPPGYLATDWYRAPRGGVDSAVLRWIDARGSYIGWTLTYDKLIHRPMLPGAPRRILPADERVSRFLEEVRPGDIVLMHDNNIDSRYLVRDLPSIIRGLERRGYRFVLPTAREKAKAV